MSSTDSTAPRCVTLGRRALHQLRQSLERDTGGQAAAYLQEAGFAGGQELFEAFDRWLAGAYAGAKPAELDAEFLGDALARFFEAEGWGAIQVSRPAPAVLALDAEHWAESADPGSAEYPTCHLSCGLLADFLGRIADGPVAVMEVECRSRGDARCRFLAGAPDTMSALYDRLARGLGYEEGLGLGAAQG